MDCFKESIEGYEPPFNEPAYFKVGHLTVALPKSWVLRVESHIHATPKLPSCISIFEAWDQPTKEDP